MSNELLPGIFMLEVLHVNSEIKKCQRALQALLRCYFMYAMQTNDRDYITKMNAIFALLERLLEENA